MSNRLRSETSPYLLQHAENPVEWHPWDDAALELARNEGRPILLSIGYSACHWCHVMAHECFEDEATAAVMNRLFVNIKVDREERPDIDRIYQTAHQLYAGRGGGWPLTAFLTPDEHLPIFIGTYFPREARYGMPAFADILERVAEYARTHADEIRERGGKLVEALTEIDMPSGDFGATLDSTPLRIALDRLAHSYDSRFGGFGDAPKFPHATSLELLLDHAGSAPHNLGSPDTPGARQILETTLRKMARSGLYDHLGGGFFRYCVDAEWQIPHFEKMLYDNAALLGVYADAFALAGDAEYSDVARATASWVLAEMQAPEGGFYATLDADSEGEEGKYYVWSRDEARARLSEQEFAVAGKRFGLTSPPNFESTHWHLTRSASLDAIAEALGLDVARAAEHLEGARAKLLHARAERIRPHRDEKRLVAWNGLMVAGLAKAARRLREPVWADAATAAVDFIRASVRDDHGLCATYKDGRARFRAYLDDYAFLALGLLELLQCRFRREDLDFAMELLDTMLAKFADPNGGFFFTASDHERLIHRSKPFADESIPAGNAVAALALQGFGHLLGETRYLDAAAATVKAGLPKLESYPEAHGTLLRALANELSPPLSIIIRGEPDTLEEWYTRGNGIYVPRSVTLAIPSSVGNLPGLLGERVPAAETIAYCCEGTVCHQPITSLSEFEGRLLGGGVDPERARR